MTDEQRASDHVLNAQSAVNDLNDPHGGILRAMIVLCGKFNADLDTYAIFADHGKPVPTSVREDATRDLANMVKRLNGAIKSTAVIDAELKQAQALLPYGGAVAEACDVVAAAERRP